MWGKRRGGRKRRHQYASQPSTSCTFESAHASSSSHKPNNKTKRTSSSFTAESVKDLLPKDPMIVLGKLTDQYDAFGEYLDQCVNVTVEHFHLLIKLALVIRKVSSNESSKVLNAFLSSSDFVKRFETAVTEIIPLSKLEGGTTNVDTLIRDLIDFLSTMFSKFQTKAREKLHLHACGLQFHLETLEHGGSSLARVARGELRDIITDSLKTKRDELKEKCNVELHEEGEIVDNSTFRDLTEYPQIKDFSGSYISREQICKELKPIKIKGSYASVEEYLNIHYRLLREDFMGPLKIGVSKYRQISEQVGRKRRKIDEIRIYQKVQCRYIELLDRGTAIQLQFDIRPLRNVRWNASKRLMFGALVVLSEDNFETMHVGVIVERDRKLLACGMVTIKFLNTTPGFGVDCVMIESVCYFEAYRHILRRLQVLPVEDFPFVNYLIYAQKIVAPPHYLARLDSMTFACTKGDWPPTLKVESPLLIRKWPSADQLGLDPSQHEALFSAITSELALIQGPPGTGKTFIGLKVLQHLLEWHAYSGPILVLCYTNHALDQFLEGINEFLPEGIVRVGNRSKSDICQKFNLREVKRAIRVPGDLQFRRKDITTALQDIERKAKSSGLELINSYGEIISLETLANVIHPAGWYQRISNKYRKLSKWLLEERTPEEIYFEVTVDLSDELNLSLFEERELCGDRRRNHDDSQFLSALINNPDVMTVEESQRVRIDTLSLVDKWRLYRMWLSEYRRQLHANFDMNAFKEFDDLTQEKEELNYEADLFVMSRCRVIGMTTTGAARYGRIMEALRPKVVIVEEAAEILESHIVAGLSSQCEQLILIGDHRQLRPSVSWEHLNRKFNLSISLFERLINNELPHVRLHVQHRMRPEIANIIRLIYDDLLDSESVQTYDDVKGVSSNVVFMRHSEPEGRDEDLKTYYNDFEADYVVELSHYFTLNGYSPSKITILVLYLGQFFLIRKKLKQRGIISVRVCNVDNFQGEENDIIILSLVRSNERGEIGYTKEENRICVALSRAKYGLFVIGNLDLFSSKSELWRKVVAHARLKGYLRDDFILECKRHNVQTAAKCVKDFENVPEGGCLNVCGNRLDCGHACEVVCHPSITDHNSVQCRKLCARVCKNGHKCSGKCYEKCPPCREEILVTWPGCGHSVFFKCYTDLDSVKCSDACEKVLPCGHQCQQKCGQICYCSQQVFKEMPYCGHSIERPCEDSETRVLCNQPCTAVLECGHKCGGSCARCCGGRIHRPCQEKCSRVLICGHTCLEPCCRGCPPCAKKCEDKCPHNTCEKTCGAPCVPCNEPCESRCPHGKCTRKCNEICDKELCNVPCESEFERCSLCKNRKKCIGLCGELCIEVCKNCEMSEFKDIFFGSEEEPDARFIRLQTCNHIFEVTGLDKWVFGEHGSDNNGGEIRLPVCPRCKTPITFRSCFRYMNHLKLVKQDVENVKKKSRKSVECKTNINLLRQRYSSLKDDFTKMASHFGLDLKTFYVKICTDRSSVTYFSSVAIQNCLTFIEKAIPLFHKKLFSLEEKTPEGKYVEHSFHLWLRWITVNQCIHASEICANELKRIEDMLCLVQVWKDISENGKKNAQNAFQFLKLSKAYGREEQSTAARMFKDVQKSLNVPGLGITPAERTQILKAVALKQGHWYKCKNGHVYVIGECGGANQRSVCPDCQCPIGGEGHRVDPSNNIATEMDGATYSAWSEQANMANYRIDD